MISTPNLWSSLKLCIHTRNVQSSAWLVKTALSRSGTCPLNIYLSMSRRVDRNAHTNSCLDAILNHSHRWKSMSFRLPSPALRKLSNVTYALPLLQTLNVWDCSPDFNGALKSHLSFAACALAYHPMFQFDRMYHQHLWIQSYHPY